MDSGKVAVQMYWGGRRTWHGQLILWEDETCNVGFWADPKKVIPFSEIENLKAELDRLKNGGCARDQRTTQFCAEAVELQKEVARLRGLLLEYGRHAEGCSGEFGYPCKCGWTNVLKEVEKGGRE